MAVTSYRQVGKGKTQPLQEGRSWKGTPTRPLSLVPTSCCIRWLTATVGGSTPATISMRRSTPVNAKQAYIDALDANLPAVQDQDQNWSHLRSLMLCIRGSETFSSFKAKTSRAKV